jgi:hypothetical protein
VRRGIRTGGDGGEAGAAGGGERGAGLKHQPDPAAAHRGMPDREGSRKIRRQKIDSANPSWAFTCPQLRSLPNTRNRMTATIELLKSSDNEIKLETLAAYGTRTCSS